MGNEDLNSPKNFPVTNQLYFGNFPGYHPLPLEPDSWSCSDWGKWAGVPVWVCAYSHVFVCSRWWQEDTGGRLSADKRKEEGHVWSQTRTFDSESICPPKSQVHLYMCIMSAAPFPDRCTSGDTVLCQEQIPFAQDFRCIGDWHKQTENLV